MTAITIKEYFAVEGSPYSNKDARKIGPVLQEISEQGGVTTRDVVDAARSPQNPLHEYFEWDDRVAADKWRLKTAQVMLASIKIKYTDNTARSISGEVAKIHETRAFHVTRTEAWGPPRKYRTFQVLHGDSAFAAQMMDAAFNDLMSWRRKYEPYVQLWKNFGDAFQAVVNQIAEFEDEVPTEQAAMATDAALANLLAWREEYSDVLKLWTAAREQIEFIMQAIGDTEQVFGLLQEKKHRDCLKCGKSFESVSVGNRICASCLNAKTINERNDGAINAQIVG